MGNSDQNQMDQHTMIKQHIENAQLENKVNNYSKQVEMAERETEKLQSDIDKVAKGLKTV